MIIRNNDRPGTLKTLLPGGIQVIKEFVQVGSLITDNGGSEKEMKRRIGKKSPVTRSHDIWNGLLILK